MSVLDLKSKAGEVRSAGASTAVQAGVDLRRVMKAADWQRISTLQRHYFRPQKLQSLAKILNV